MPKKVLIVEDERDIREAMAEAIEDAGFSVETATDGKEGYSAALDYKPDLILLDIRMPLKDGLTMLSELRADPWGKDAKVIIMTAMDDVASITKAHGGNLQDYLIKTHTSLEELVKTVRLNIYAE